MKSIIIRALSLLGAVSVLLSTGIMIPTAYAEDTAAPRLEGKTISILGDSISTFHNASNGSAADTTNSTIRNNLEYYSGSNYGVTLRKQTWWQQSADRTGAKILVNNSWSASCFSAERWGSIPAAYQDRCVQLHDNTGDNAGQEPDIIAVFMGTNDFHMSRSLTDQDSHKINVAHADGLDYSTLCVNGVYKTPSNTSEAYAIMLDKIIKRYPNAELYCFTLIQSDHVNAGTSPYAQMNNEDIQAQKDFNDDIVTIAQHYGAFVVDLYNDSGIVIGGNFSQYMANYVHPNAEGMTAIADCFLSCIAENSQKLHTHDEEMRYEEIPATCITEGKKTYTCNSCGVSETQIINKTFHTYDDDFDADCNVCGKLRNAKKKPVEAESESTDTSEPISAQISQSNGCGASVSCGIFAVAASLIFVAVVKKKSREK